MPQGGTESQGGGRDGRKRTRHEHLTRLVGVARGQDIGALQGLRGEAEDVVHDEQAHGCGGGARVVGFHAGDGGEGAAGLVGARRDGGGRDGALRASVGGAAMGRGGTHAGVGLRWLRGHGVGWCGWWW